MNEEYFKRGIDLKRLYLRFLSRVWLLIMLMAVGAVAGGVAYQVARAMRMPVAYEAVSKLYISFGVDESGEIYQYYNGYTWNDLLDTDPILDRIMAYVPENASREEISAATKAEILSDIRLLTITVEGSTEKFVREVQAAVEKGLVDYGEASEELKRIEVIRTGDPLRVYWDDRTITACAGGAVLFGVIACLFMAFFYVLDESIYVPGDVEKKYPFRALGIMTRKQKGLQPYARELKANISYILGDKRSFGMIDMENHSDVRRIDLEKLLNAGRDEALPGRFQRRRQSERKRESGRSFPLTPTPCHRKSAGGSGSLEERFCCSPLERMLEERPPECWSFFTIRTAGCLEW